MSLSKHLRAVGEVVRKHIGTERSVSRDSVVVSVQGGDTIYGIDKRVEPAIRSALEAWPSDMKPVVVISEGFGHSGRIDVGDTSRGGKFRLLLDPIDGTRSLMYDKRSAWFLAAIAPDLGESTKLSDSLAAVMMEIPTSKQSWVESFSVEKGASIVGIRSLIGSKDIQQFVPRPSMATTLRNGFGQVSNFFPGTKRLASDLMEDIAESTLGKVEAGTASIFDDQYISTGGQLVELICGKDRFCCDLRPLFYKIIEAQNGISIERGLECHPYDMAGLLVAKSAGVVITDGYGRSLDAPFDVRTGVHWCGYANESLRSLIEPIIHRWLEKKGLEVPRER